MKTYTIDQFRLYLERQESFGDVFYNLTEEKIDEAQIPIENEEEDIDF